MDLFVIKLFYILSIILCVTCQLDISDLFDNDDNEPIKTKLTTELNSTPTSKSLKMTSSSDLFKTAENKNHPPKEYSTTNKKTLFKKFTTKPIMTKLFTGSLQTTTETIVTSKLTSFFTRIYMKIHKTENYASTVSASPEILVTNDKTPVTFPHSSTKEPEISATKLMESLTSRNEDNLYTTTSSNNDNSYTTSRNEGNSYTTTSRNQGNSYTTTSSNNDNSYTTSRYDGNSYTMTSRNEGNLYTTTSSNNDNSYTKTSLNEENLYTKDLRQRFFSSRFQTTTIINNENDRLQLSSSQSKSYFIATTKQGDSPSMKNDNIQSDRTSHFTNMLKSTINPILSKKTKNDLIYNEESGGSSDVKLKSRNKMVVEEVIASDKKERYAESEECPRGSCGNSCSSMKPVFIGTLILAILQILVLC